MKQATNVFIRRLSKSNVESETLREPSSEKDMVRDPYTNPVVQALPTSNSHAHELKA
jgi:hypothetical protein